MWAKTSCFEQQYLSGVLELELKSAGYARRADPRWGCRHSRVFHKNGCGGQLLQKGSRSRSLRVKNMCEKPGCAPTSPSSRHGVPIPPATSCTEKRLATLNPEIASAGRMTVAEVEEIVEAGALAPDCIHTPGIYVDRIIRSTINDKRIEKLTTRSREVA